jgi:hypothetical protein
MFSWEGITGSLKFCDRRSWHKEESGIGTISLYPPVADHLFLFVDFESTRLQTHK